VFWFYFELCFITKTFFKKNKKTKKTDATVFILQFARKIEDFSACRNAQKIFWIFWHAKKFSTFCAICKIFVHKS